MTSQWLGWCELNPCDLKDLPMKRSISFHRPSAVMAAAVLALLLFGSACSSSNDTTDGTANAADVAATNDTNSDSTTLDSETDEPAGGDTASGDPEKVDPSDLFGENCKDAVERFDDLENQMGSSLAGQVPDLDGLRKNLADLADGAPAEVKEDFEVVEEQFGSFLEELSKLGLGDGQQLSVEKLQKLGSLSTTIDSEALSTATDNIERYFDENCGDGS